MRKIRICFPLPPQKLVKISANTWETKISLICVLWSSCFACQAAPDENFSPFTTRKLVAKKNIYYMDKFLRKVLIYKGQSYHSPAATSDISREMNPPDRENRATTRYVTTEGSLSEKFSKNNTVVLQYRYPCIFFFFMVLFSLVESSTSISPRGDLSYLIAASSE
jgi:hypothetical protein